MNIVKEYFTYVNGHLVRTKTDSKNKLLVGSRFGGQDKRGYISGWFKGKKRKEHHLVWFYHYGEWPQQLDHINGIRDDNRIENLRKCSQSENTRNRPGDSNTSSKYKGVHWHKNNKRWRTTINYDGKRISLGCFSSEKEAAKAYDTKAKELYGEFARLNLEKDYS